LPYKHIYIVEYEKYEIGIGIIMAKTKRKKIQKKEVPVKKVGFSHYIFAFMALLMLASTLVAILQ